MSADVTLQRKFQKLAKVQKTVLDMKGLGSASADADADANADTNDALCGGRIRTLKQVLVVELACLHPMNQSVARTLRMLRSDFARVSDHHSAVQVSEVSKGGRRSGMRRAPLPSRLPQTSPSQMSLGPLQPLFPT